MLLNIYNQISQLAFQHFQNTSVREDCDSHIY